MLAGAPTDDASFKEAIKGTEAVMAAVAPTIRSRGCGVCRGRSWAEQCRKCRERRGDFKAISVGVSYGGGQTVRTFFPSLYSTLTLRDIRLQATSINTGATDRALSDYWETKMSAVWRAFRAVSALKHMAGRLKRLTLNS